MTSLHTQSKYNKYTPGLTDNKQETKDSNKINYMLSSQPALHEFCQNKYVIPYLEAEFGQYNPQKYRFEQYAKNEKNADVKLGFHSPDMITIERKYDKSLASKQVAFELLVNIPNGIFAPGRTKTYDDKYEAVLQKLYNYVYTQYVDKNHLGLIFAKINHLGRHFTQVIKTYAGGKAELYLLDTVKFQQEVLNMITELDIGATFSKQRGEAWTSVMTYIQFPSIHCAGVVPNVTESVVLGPIDVTYEHANLCNLYDIPTDFK